MNLAHVHIVLNHVPSLGTIVAVCLFLLSLTQRNDGLKKLSLQVFVAMALLALPTYMTGNAAQQIIHTESTATKELIEAHQNSAIITLILMTITGTFAWFGLWQFRRFSRPGSGNTSAVLIFSILAMIFILRTANMGGDIRHEEIRIAEATPPPAPIIGWQESVALYTNDHSWVWPASETVHFIGMALLFGVALLVNLRMLGMMKSIPFAAVHRLLPLGIFGFVINVISGMVFFMANPPLYFLNPAFKAKIALLVLSGIGLIYFTLFDRPFHVGPEQDAPLLSRVVAATTMSLLLGVMYFGRMLPFISH